MAERLTVDDHRPPHDWRDLHHLLFLPAALVAATIALAGLAGLFI